jgi:hypothetical protein
MNPANTLLRLLGQNRCYPFWQEVLGCYVVNSGEGEAGKKKCVPALEDYYECLHHRKEVRTIPIDIFCEFEMQELSLMEFRDNRLSVL